MTSQVSKKGEMMFPEKVLEIRNATMSIYAHFKPLAKTRRISDQDFAYLITQLKRIEGALPSHEPIVLPKTEGLEVPD